MESMDINAERLAQTFLELVQIDSISKEEGQLAQTLMTRLQALGGRVRMDDAGQQVGGDAGNVLAHFRGNRQTSALLLSAHMDTVEPGRGVRPRIQDGVFASSGDTILGADDKGALAIILEVLQSLQEQHLPCGPLEVVFSICEEIGLLGAKHLAYDQISARVGYVLDTSNPGAIITRAPAANKITFKIYGKAAHAGSSPEKGINAISLASKAIAQLEIGRIDHETTCNIGLIEGGLATNIVPSLVVAKGEVRSHDARKLAQATATIRSSFEQVVAAYQDSGQTGHPRLEVEVLPDFERLHIEEDHPAVKTAMQAARNLGQPLETASSGGGSDANVFAGKGIASVVLGTGMQNVHTVDESIRLNDMLRSARLLREVIRLHALRESDVKV